MAKATFKNMWASLATIMLAGWSLVPSAFLYLHQHQLERFACSTFLGVVRVQFFSSFSPQGRPLGSQIAPYQHGEKEEKKKKKKKTLFTQIFVFVFSNVMFLTTRTRYIDLDCFVLSRR